MDGVGVDALVTGALLIGRVGRIRHIKRRTDCPKFVILRFAVTAIAVLLAGNVSSLAAQRRAAPKPTPRPTGELRALFESNFTQWDRNQDGLLDTRELNALIESPQVRGTEAAAAFILRKRIIAAHKDDDESQAENEDRNLTRAQVMALGDDVATQREVKRTTAHIQKISRELFLPTDPNLATFHQGRVGDCYFMSGKGSVNGNVTF